MCSPAYRVTTHDFKYSGEATDLATDNISFIPSVKFWDISNVTFGSSRQYMYDTLFSLYGIGIGKKVKAAEGRQT